MNFIKKFADNYNNIEKWILITMTIVMVIVIFSQVFTRYVMGNALYWSEELGKFIFVWISWLGVSAGMKEKEHIQVLMIHTALFKKGCKKTVKVLEILVSVLWFITSIIICIHGSQIVGMQMETGVYGASTQLPMWIAYLCVPVSAAVVCIRLISQSVKDIGDLIRLYSGKGKEVAY